MPTRFDRGNATTDNRGRMRIAGEIRTGTRTRTRTRTGTGTGTKTKTKTRNEDGILHTSKMAMPVSNTYLANQNPKLSAILQQRRLTTISQPLNPPTCPPKVYQRRITQSPKSQPNTPTPKPSPFGVMLENRRFEPTPYRYGFNSQEKDNEVAGNGNSYTAEFWQYDARLGRRWNLDPVIKPIESPFCAFSNSPLYIIDINGADTSFASDSERADFLNMIERTCSEIDRHANALANAQKRLLNATTSKERKEAQNDINYHKGMFDKWSQFSDILQSVISSPYILHFEGKSSEDLSIGIFGEFYYKLGQGYTVEYTGGRLSTMAHEMFHFYQFITYQTSLSLNLGIPGYAYDQADEVDARFISILFDPSELTAIKKYNAQSNTSDINYVSNWVNLAYVNRGIKGRRAQILVTSADIAKWNLENYEAGKNGGTPVQLFPGWEEAYKRGLSESSMPGAESFFLKRIFGEGN